MQKNSIILTIKVLTSANSQNTVWEYENDQIKIILFSINESVIKKIGSIINVGVGVKKESIKAQNLV